MSNPVPLLLFAQYWQIAVLIVFAVVVERCLGPKRSHVAYVLWLLVMLKCLTPPLVANPAGVFSRLQAQLDLRIADYAQQASDDAQSPVRLTNGSRESTARPIRSDEQTTAVAMTSGGSRPREVYIPSQQDASATRTNNGHRADRPALSRTVAFDVLTLNALAVRGVAVLFVLSVAFLAFAMLRVSRTVRRAVDDQVVPQIDLTMTIVRLSDQLGLRRTPRLIVTRQHLGPAVLGVFRPALMLPHCVVESATAEELEPILAHELLHIRRGDLRVGFLQMLTLSLWWFHPAVWIASRFLTRATERCCDEETLAALQCPPQTYARALLRVLEVKHTLLPVPVVPGIRPMDLTSQRIGRIMKLTKGCRNRTPAWCWVTLILAAAIILPGAAAVSDAQNGSQQTEVSSQPPVPDSESIAWGTDQTSAESKPVTTGGIADSTVEAADSPNTSEEPSTDNREVQQLRQMLQAAEQQCAARLDFTEQYQMNGAGWTFEAPLGFRLAQTQIRNLELRLAKAQQAQAEQKAYVRQRAAQSTNPEAIETAASAGIEALPAPKLQNRKSPLTLRVYQVADLVVPHQRAAGAPLRDSDFGPLASLIRTSVDPKSWKAFNDGDNGKAVISPNVETLSIVVAQTQENHNAISELLEQARSFDAQQLIFEIVAISIVGIDSQFTDALNKAAPSIQHASMVAIIRDEEVVAIHETVKKYSLATIIARPKITTFSGQDASFQTSGQDLELSMSLNGTAAPKGSLIRMTFSAMINESDLGTSPPVFIESGQTIVARADISDDNDDNILLLITPRSIRRAADEN